MNEKYRLKKLSTKNRISFTSFNMKQKHIFWTKIFWKKKMKVKTHIDFLVNYDSINIFLIWISNQRKIIRTRDITFDENSRYRFNKINLIQLINEFFLINDTFDISQNDFTKIMNIESNNEKKLWKLTFMNFIIERDAKRDAKKSFNRMIENDSKSKYLLLFISSSSKNENISNTFDFSSFVVTKNSSSFVVAKTIKELFSSASFLKKKKSKHWSKTTINKTNIQFEKIIRIRKSNSIWNFNHYIVLKNAIANEMRSFYETFIISITKKNRIVSIFSSNQNFIIKCSNMLKSSTFYESLTWKSRHYNQSKFEKIFHEIILKTRKKIYIYDMNIQIQIRQWKLFD